MNEQLEQFYKTLRASGQAGLEEVRLILGDGRNGHDPIILWYGSWQKVLADIERLSDYNSRGYNVYSSVNPRTKESGKKDAVSSGCCLWADLDFKDYQGGESEARERLSKFKHEPNIIVRTGHGLHCYWILRQPTTALARVEQINKAIATILGGDSVGDISRVMRLPGFSNVKNPADPIPAVLEDCQAFLDYEIDDFNFLFQPQPTQPPVAVAVNADTNLVAVHPADVDSLNINREIKDLIRDGALGGSRSEALAAVYSALLDCGLQDGQIINMILQNPIGDKAREKPNPHEWLRQEIERARQWKASQSQPPQTGQIKLISSEELLSDDGFEIEAIVEDMLYKKAITMIAGPPGSGKSAFALWLMATLAGRSITWLSKPPVGIRTLYYTLEDPRGETRKRHKAHVETLRPDQSLIAFRRESDDFDTVRQAVMIHQADLLIIDSLSIWQLQYVDNENDNRQATRLMMTLRQFIDELNIALLLVHHVSKPNPNSRLGSQPVWATFRGAGAYVAQSDIALAMAKEDDLFTITYAKNRLSMKGGNVRLKGDKHYGFSATEEKKSETNTEAILDVMDDKEMLIREEIIERARARGCSKNDAKSAFKLALANKKLISFPDEQDGRTKRYMKANAGNNDLHAATMTKEDQ